MRSNVDVKTKVEEAFLQEFVVLGETPVLFVNGLVWNLSFCLVSSLIIVKCVSEEYSGYGNLSRCQ